MWLEKTKYEFLFFLELLFLEPYFFWHNVWPEKSMSSFFLEPILLLAQCSARTNMMFLLELILFLEPIFSFWHNVWPEKYEFLFFFWEPILFLALCWARKSMSLSVHFFVTHTFFGTFFWHPYFFLAQFLARKNISSFSLELVYFF